jgi:hypothetical protein
LSSRRAQTRGEGRTRRAEEGVTMSNELSGEDALPLLARLMASAIVKEDGNNMDQFYVQSLIDYYVDEYYKFGPPPYQNATEDPNMNEPSTIKHTSWHFSASTSLSISSVDPQYV